MPNTMILPRRDQSALQGIVFFVTNVICIITPGWHSLKGAVKLLRLRYIWPMQFERQSNCTLELYFLQLGIAERTPLRWQMWSTVLNQVVMDCCAFSNEIWCDSNVRDRVGRGFATLPAKIQLSGQISHLSGMPRRMIRIVNIRGRPGEWSQPKSDVIRTTGWELGEPGPHFLPLQSVLGKFHAESIWF